MKKPPRRELTPEEYAFHRFTLYGRGGRRKPQQITLPKLSEDKWKQEPSNRQKNKSPSST